MGELSETKSTITDGIPGKLYLNGTLATHIYFDFEIAARKYGLSRSLNSAEAVVPVSDATVSSSSKVSEQATTNDGSLSGSLSTTRREGDVEDNAPKKARLE
ncbi:unnamed protein product [Eruca vesicaria subsp. sativa]|uniref:Uncharacterized protein n=1 Tax=Eruca vesicaria subsp. sativa TaxID=29727 RepID=A0ABC8K8R6_ERUVS|nr:unnamed protein product [Eruca vesicaria subsp. sativa]